MLVSFSKDVIDEIQRVIYCFNNTQVANRFLNALESRSMADVEAKFYRNERAVKVSGEFSDVGFDNTYSELNDLASHY